jgi:hypothetical protein
MDSQVNTCKVSVYQSSTCSGHTGNDRIVKSILKKRTPLQDLSSAAVKI